MQRASYSMVIRNQTGKRIFFLKIKFFLELCGYVILEEWENARLSSEKYDFRTIGLYLKKMCKTNTDDFSIEADKVEDSLVLLCAILAADTQDRDILNTLLKLYKDDVFMNLYSICYLYAKRGANYQNNNEVLRDAIEGLIDVCEQMENDFVQRKVDHWRELYFYLYLVNRVNEGSYKMRGYAYRKYDELKEWFEQLKMIAPNQEEILLLEAETIRNTQGNYLDHLAVYGKLENSSSYCVRFWVLFAIGELYIEQASNKYNNVYGDENLITKADLYEGAMKYFEKLLELKSDEVRAIFKLGLQSERRSLSEGKYLKEAKERYLNIKKILEHIPLGQSTTLEFEYLYKTYLRLCSICQSEGEFSSAKEYLDEAVNKWEQLNEYSLFEEIYGVDAKDKIIGVLEKKYSEKNRTFEINRVANSENRNLLWAY